MSETTDHNVPGGSLNAIPARAGGIFSVETSGEVTVFELASKPIDIASRTSAAPPQAAHR